MTATQRPPIGSLAASGMAGAALAWLDALHDGQRAKAAFALDDEAERRRWAYFPREFHGLPLLEMDARQQKLAHALVAGALSMPAYAKVTAIMALESVLHRIEGGALNSVRDPGRYFVSLFGTPGGEAPWGWRFEGHHVSLNFMIAAGDIVSPTPIFFGANPADVRHGEHAVLRPLSEEEDLARGLLGLLDAEQRREAVICDTAPPDIVMLNLPSIPDTREPEATDELRFLRRDFELLTSEQRAALRYERARPRGLPASHMDASQRSLLSALVDVYVQRLGDELSPAEAARLAEAGEMHFAWAGDERPRRPHYYRLQAGAFLVEYDNTQNDANHVHAVWRDADGDFGSDVLRRHVREEHR